MLRQHLLWHRLWLRPLPLKQGQQLVKLHGLQQGELALVRQSSSLLLKVMVAQSTGLQRL